MQRLQGLPLSRILAGLGAIVFAAALIIGGSGAFFSDTETSTGNTFSAGDIDLQIDNESYVTNADGQLVFSSSTSWGMSNLTNQLFFNFDDVKPGDIGEDTISIHAGSNNAWACMAADLTATPDNGINDPEADAGDVTDGDGGELQNFLNFSFWNDDGDNVYETGETIIAPLTGPASTIFNGSWLAIADSTTGSSSAIVGGSTRYIGKAWCFGTLMPAPVAQGASTSPLVRGTGFTCDGSGNNNIAQTDGISVDVSFQATQSRNNAQFLCSSLPPIGNGTTTPPVDNEINQIDLATSTADVIANPSAWFFYNDTNDTIMTIDQFAANNGQNHMELVAGEEGAKMVLHDAGGPANPRYNIATAQYGNVLLSSIGPLTYRIYDDSASAETPFLHFNVDFFNTGLFQSRLVMVPTVAAGNDGVPTDTWMTVDAIDGGNAMWTYSGATWPAPNVEPGTTPKTWTEIITDYPLAETLASPGAFLGVRVGHPGPLGETSFVSSINFDGIISNFEI
ncbi:MAG: TasA family protein [Minisyncoccia bacterium]